MYGIINHDSIVGHSMHNNYRLALYNYFGIQNFKEIRNIHNLSGISHLFIVDEHLQPHVNIWRNKEFIDGVNQANIVIIILNTEKIYIPAFPWNVETQKAVGLFKHCYQFLSDAEEADELNKPFNKFYTSKSTNFNIPIKPNKINKILFIGAINTNEYNQRNNIIKEIEKMNLNVELKIINRHTVSLTYAEYLENLNNYKYILCPMGTGNFFCYRHFESLYFNCIPIQQTTTKMSIKYEADLKNCIYFINPEEIKEKLSYIPTIEKRYLEDLFDELKLKEIVS